MVRYRLLMAIGTTLRVDIATSKIPPTRGLASFTNLIPNSFMQLYLRRKGGKTLRVVRPYMRHET